LVVGNWIAKPPLWATGLLLIAGTRDACPYHFRISVSQFRIPVRSGEGAASPKISASCQRCGGFQRCSVSGEARFRVWGRGVTRRVAAERRCGRGYSLKPGSAATPQIAQRFDSSPASVVARKRIINVANVVLKMSQE